jgi:hypothetical protein
MNNFVVYAHYTADTKKLFYIGEGRPNRSTSRHSRNRFWNHVVKKHGGFLVTILHHSLTKEEATCLETKLIKQHRNADDHLVNFCDGPMFDKHWLLGAPKEIHPMFGKKNPTASARMIEYNKQRSGKLSPTYGKKRQDLAEQNKLGSRKIICVETKQMFESIREAEEHLGCHTISVILNNPNRTRKKLHFADYHDYQKYGDDIYLYVYKPKVRIGPHPNTGRKRPDLTERNHQRAKITERS